LAELAGRLRYIKVLAGSVAMVGAGAPTGTAVGGVDNDTYRKLCDLVEISAYGDTHKKRLAAMKDTSVTLSGNLITTDAGQLILEPGDTIMLAVHPGGATTVGKQVNCIVESFEDSCDALGKQTFTATVQGNAAPVASPAHS
jgi:hypothetical protein